MNTEKITDHQRAQNNAFLDRVSHLRNCKNDAALCRALEVAPPMISKIRHGRRTVGAALMIRAHEVTGMPFIEIRHYVPDLPRPQAGEPS